MKVRIIWKSRSSAASHQSADNDAPPRGLVDACSHILWGLDYGLIDLDLTLSILNGAANHGTTDIVVTPRTSLQSQFDPETSAHILNEIRLRSDSSIRIHIGRDFLFGFSNISDVLSNPLKYTINGLTYLNVDFTNAPLTPAADDILFKFRKEGLIPIISHAEKILALDRSMERLKAWTSMGCVLQLSAQSLSGKVGKTEQRCAWDLLREDMVFAIASYGRDLRKNPPRLDGAWRLVKKKLGEDVARRLLIENPSMIIQGRTQGRKPAAPEILSYQAATG